MHVFLEQTGVLEKIGLLKELKFVRNVLFLTPGNDEYILRPQVLNSPGNGLNCPFDDGGRLPVDDDPSDVKCKSVWDFVLFH